jgi:hypothetical protein
VKYDEAFSLRDGRDRDRRACLPVPNQSSCSVTTRCELKIDRMKR